MKVSRRAFSAGYTCLVTWADLIDRINVFPVADGDTGSNLRISLAPLAAGDQDREELAERLSRCAVGNSGNIASVFFRELVAVRHSDELEARLTVAERRARRAVEDPSPGTMLSLFSGLAALPCGVDAPDAPSRIREHLARIVRDSVGELAELADAGVVDAGALGMFVLFDGFFQVLHGVEQPYVAVNELFAGLLLPDPPEGNEGESGYCVDGIVEACADPGQLRTTLASLGESVVVASAEQGIKLHVHTHDPDRLREACTRLGRVADWSADPLVGKGAFQGADSPLPSPLHIITDAAGSLPPDLAALHGITLLDSLVVADGRARPESLCVPGDIYARLRAGERVTTAQPSREERFHLFDGLCRRYGPCLYLGVGSAFTGNVAVARRWRKSRDDRLEVVDTGAASGRLGLIALLTARAAAGSDRADRVIEYARHLSETCEEYVCIDALSWLVAGGRVSRAGGFFGDLLHLKPVISPHADGVRRQATLRSHRAQLDFCLHRLEQEAGHLRRPVLLLQYSDNRDWLTGTVEPALRSLLPGAEILVVPLSLTAGVHMGPGTWGVAFTREEV